MDTRRDRRITRLNKWKNLGASTQSSAAFVALIILFINLVIFLGVFFGIYNPLLKLEWKTGLNCRVNEVLDRHIGLRASGPDAECAAIADTELSPMPIAVIELTTEDNRRISTAVACATKRARALSSTAGLNGCKPLASGTGYAYQLHAGRPAVWLCSECKTDHECNNKWEVGDTVPKCQYTEDSPGLNPYVLWDREEMWLPAEYYAMWIVGFGIGIVLPSLVLLWLLLWSRHCGLYTYLRDRPYPPATFEEATRWLTCATSEGAALGAMAALESVPPHTLPHNAREQVLRIQELLRSKAAASRSATGSGSGLATVGNTGSPAVMTRLAALLRRLPDSNVDAGFLPEPNGARGPGWQVAEAKGAGEIEMGARRVSERAAPEAGVGMGNTPLVFLESNPVWVVDVPEDKASVSSPVGSSTRTGPSSGVTASIAPVSGSGAGARSSISTVEESPSVV